MRTLRHDFSDWRASNYLDISAQLKCAIIGLPVWSAVCPAQLLATQTSQTRREIRSAAVTGSGDFRTETLARLWNFPFLLSSNQIPRC